jgi:transposase InsO family protein
MNCYGLLGNDNKLLRRKPMIRPLHPVALFRLSVLGALASRAEFARGEIKQLISELASKTYNIPDSRRTHLSEQTILHWYHAWKRGGVEALAPKLRIDKGNTKLIPVVQEALLRHKKDKPSRSINTLIVLVERQGLVAHGELSRATVHRFLQQHQQSTRILTNTNTIERRSFVAERAGDIWHGDVLHGPRIQTPHGLRKTYLVSLQDDASRLIVHSAFCFGETALDIEGILKQAVLKRGVPVKLIIDNGAAYRAASLQTICALLEIRLIYCRPYEPEGKGKLERFHRTFRAQFLNEINIDAVADIHELNARLWAWLEQEYHCRAHDGLQGKTPLARWREDLCHVRQLGLKVHKLNDMFYHRIKRYIHKDGTVSWQGIKFEVSHDVSHKDVILVIDPHTKTALRIESMNGDDLGVVVAQDKLQNLHRKRQRPSATECVATQRSTNVVELAYQEHSQSLAIPSQTKKEQS